MATLANDLDATPSPTPPPIPSQSNDINDNRPSYRRSSRKHINKTISTFYENSDQKKKIGQLIDGAPTKEHRLLEYFLVISFNNEELKIRERSPLMDIFDNFNKRTHHHHAYVVHPNQTQPKKKRHSKKHKHKVILDEKQEEKGNNLSPTSKSPKPPKTPPPPTPTLTSVDYTHIEKIRGSSGDINAEEITNPFGNLRFEPSVIDRFPPLDHADTAIISTDTQLQYFCLPTGLFLTKFPSLPIFYTFVWTPETGEHLYGCCLRFFEQVNPNKIYEFCQKDNENNLKHLNIKHCKGYFAPKCICLISYHSFIDGYRVFLTELYRLSLTPSKIPIERYLCNFFLECPLPPKGYFSVRYNIGDKSFLMARAPANNPLSESCVSTRILFELFTIDDIMKIYKSILLEDKILFISTQYSILSVICEIFISLLYPFEWPHVYIPMLPEDFLAFLKAPTVFMIGTHKSLLMQIGDEIDDDILVVDINNGTMQYGYNNNNNNNNNNIQINQIPNIELPKHEKLKLVRFLTPVSNLLYGSRQHDFHQLDLAFPVAPTPDMIEQQEQLQKQRFKKMKTHTSSHRRKNSDSLKAIHQNDTNFIDEYIADNDENNNNNNKKKRFSLNKFKFKKPTLGKMSKMTSLTNLGMNLRNRSDSIEPAIKSYKNSPFKTENINNKKKTKHKLKRSQSEATTINKPFNRQDSGTLADIVESPINQIFDDAAVRNGFLRFWLSIFRSYQECIIRPHNVTNSINSNNLAVHLSEPIYEDSATKTLDKKSPIPTIMDDGVTTEDELQIIHNKNDTHESSKSGTSSFNSAASGTPNGLIFGQSVESIFDEDKFLKSSPSQSRPFLSIFLGTEAFNRFIYKCVFEYDTNTNVKYFNEKIIQKLGRSRFTKAQPTPFLNNKDYIISHEFLCPKPYIDDLECNKKYIYPDWPKLNGNLYAKPRRKYRHKSHGHHGTTNSKSSNYTNKDIISNEGIYDESSITFEPSKSQTITSTIISPPHKKPTTNSTITPHDKHYYSNDHNIIREEDEYKEHIDDDEDVVVLQLGDINNKDRNNSNPFSHDRVTYHLWFYIFIRTLIPNNNDSINNNNNNQERALHLMIKIMSQMKNESVGLPDKWVFNEIIQSMDRMKWGSHVIKLVQVMLKLQYNLDATIYSSLLSVLTKEYGDLETAYNILGKLPSGNDAIDIGRDRKNSLLMNCTVKPLEKRKKFYETISELQNRFSQTFPGRSILIKQECPYCAEAIHDVHIRMGWSNNDQSTNTKCPSCHKQFDAKFLIKESQTYKVWFHNIQSIKALNFFKMRGDKGTYIKNINFNNISNQNINKERQNAIINTISEGDQITNINGKDITNKSLNEIYEIIRNPPIINDNNLIKVPDIEESLSSRSKSDYDTNDDNNEHSHKLKKQSTKSKLMKLMKLNDKNNKNSQPICITFRRVVLCPYFSPLILYGEIKKVIQNHALSQSNNYKTRGSVSNILADENKENDSNTPNRNSYRKKNNISKEDIKKLLQDSGISAISTIDFRIKHCELFWNLAWHFSNLRLPLHFLQNAFEDKSQMNTAQIDDLIDFVPLTVNELTQK